MLSTGVPGFKDNNCSNYDIIWLMWSKILVLPRGKRGIVILLHGTQPFVANMLSKKIEWYFGLTPFTLKSSNFIEFIQWMIMILSELDSSFLIKFSRCSFITAALDSPKSFQISKSFKWKFGTHPNHRHIRLSLFCSFHFMIQKEKLPRLSPSFYIIHLFHYHSSDAHFSKAKTTLWLFHINDGILTTNFYGPPPIGFWRKSAVIHLYNPLESTSFC